MGNRLSKLLSDHISEVYGTLTDNEGIRNYLDHISKQTKKALPILEHDPQNVSMNDIINSGFGVMPLSTGKLPPTAFSNAHDIAQKNAVEMLGLPPNNTAMDRARAMGFDIDNPVFHYSRSEEPFDSFNNYTSGKTTSFLDGIGVHTGTKDAANDRFNKYWKNSKSDKKGFTMPLLIKNKNQLLNNDEPYTEEQLKKFIETKLKKANIDFKNKPREAQILTREGLSNKYDSIPYINKVEDKGSISNITPDPTTVRSRFAAFDPAQKNSANILASILAGTALYRNRKDKNVKP